MANSFNSLTAFVQEERFALDFYTKAVQDNDVLPFVQSVGLFIPGVKEDTIKLPNLSAVAGIADGAACAGTDFDDGNDTTISQSSVTLTKGIVKDSICIHSEGFETYVTATALQSGQNYTGLGALENGLMNEIQRKVAKRLAQNLWNGNSSPDTWTFNGWLDQLYAATMGSGIIGSTTPTSGGSAGTDAAGVYNIIQAMIDAAMADVDFAADVMMGRVYIVLSPKEAEFLRQNYLKLYGQALPTPGLAELQNNVFAPITFPGTRIPIYQQSSLTGTGTIIMSRMGNQVLAVDNVTDFTNLDMWLADDHDTLRWKFRFKMGVGWRDLTSDSVKYWGPTT
jgi:hypothetical protein